MTFTVTRPKKVFRLATPHPVGSMLDAAGAVMSMLRTAALTELPQLEAVLGDTDDARHAEVAKKLSKFELTAEQVDAIRRDHYWLSLIRRGQATIAVCDTCGEVSVVDTAPTKCRTRQHCPGKPVKAGFAKGVPLGAEIAPAVEEETC